MSEAASIDKAMHAADCAFLSLAAKWEPELTFLQTTALLESFSSSTTPSARPSSTSRTLESSRTLSSSSPPTTDSTSSLSLLLLDNADRFLSVLQRIRRLWKLRHQVHEVSDDKQHSSQRHRNL